MSANLKNLAALSLRKGVYFVPLQQDDPVKKPASLVADFSRLGEALAAAREGRQLRPLFV
jgi:dipicolinate synthase subunit B